MDHVKGALGPLASMVREFPKILECKKPSEAGRELIPSHLESLLKNEGEGGIGFIEIIKQFECQWQMELNKELESPDLKRHFVSLYSRLTSLIREGDYTEDLDESEKVKVWAEARELSYDLEDVVEKFLVYLQDSRRLGRLPEIDTLKKLMQKMANLQLGENIPMDEMINDVPARPASTTTIDPSIQAFYTEIPGLVGMSGNMDSLIHMISDENVPKVTSEMPEKHSGTYDKSLTEVPEWTSEKMSSNDPDPVPDDSQYEDRKMSSNDPGPVKDDSQYEDRNMPSKIKPKVACVVGFGGLGKTTLVRTLYDKIKKDFSCKAFVTVGRNADEKKVLMDILLALDNEKKEKGYTIVDLLRFNELQLTKELEEFLSRERYLIVIDDIWKENSWEFIECAFHNECHLGSQVFTTTRSISVAQACCSSSDGRLIYQMEPLSDEDSNSLFYNRVFSHEGGQCHDDFKQVSAAILKKCGGVPLAIITIASLLANNGEGIKPISEWNHLLKSIGSGLTKAESVLLYLSYDDLPPELKNCLLYMVVFPEDYVIKKDHLVSKWIAEDFVRRTNQEDSLFEIAENYFNMLIKRSMIEPVNIDGEGKAKACRVHDMVLGFLCSLSSEANFVTIIDGSIRTTSNSQSKIRRLSIQNCMATPQVFLAEHSDVMEHVRSFTLSASNHVFDRKEQTFYKLLCEAENGHKKHMEPLSTFQVLRVLDLRDCCPWLACHQINPLQVGGLLHLRYLGLRNTMFNILPTDVGKLKFLQILDYRNHGIIKELPSSIVELRGLIYLRVDPATRLPGDFGKLTSLEKLTHVVVNQDSAYLAKELGYLTNLRVLRITPEDMDENLAEELVESLNKLLEIRTLDFRAPSDDKNVLGPGDCVRCMGESWEPSSHLQKFCADNYYCFRVLPKWITESCNISSLSICLKEVGREDIEILGRLQYLRYLKLTKEDRDNMYPAKPEECFQFENDAFPVARELRIVGIVTLPAMFPKGAMPKVQILEFHVRLEDFGNGNGNMNLEMAHLPALKKVKVIIWYKIDVQKVTNGAQGSFNENYTIVRNYVHEVIGAHVKDAEAALRAAAESHPNRPTTDIETKRYEHDGDLGKNKFQLLMGLLKIAEEEAADKRIRFSDTEAFDVIVSRQQHITENGQGRRFPSQPPLDLATAIAEKMSPATAFREIVLARRATRDFAKTTCDEGLAFSAKSYAQAVDVHASREPLRLKEIGEASGLPFLPLLDSDEAKFKFELLLSMWNNDEDEAAEKQLRSIDMEAVDVHASREPLRLTEIEETSGLPFLPPLDSDEGKLKFELLLSMLKNKEIFQEHRVVEESMSTKLIEDKAREVKGNAATNDAEASATCKGKEKIIYTSDDHDVKGSHQPLGLTEISEASGFSSLSSLDPDEDMLKFALLLSMFKNEDEEEIFQKHRVVEESMATKLAEDRARAAKGNAATNNAEASATCKGNEEIIYISGSRQPLRLTEIGEASGFPSLPSLDPDEDKLKLALLLSMSKNEDEEEIFQKYRVVEESMATKLVEDRERAAKGNAAANDPNPTPPPHPRIPTPPLSPRALTLPPIVETRSAPMVEEPSASGMTVEGNGAGLEVGIADSIIFQNTLPDAMMEDVTVVIDAEVTKGEAASKVDEAEIVRPVAEEEPSKSKSTASVSVKEIASHVQLDSSKEVVVYGQNLQRRLRVPYSSAESLDELEQKMLSVMASIRLAKEAVQYELDMSRQEAKDLVLKNTDLDMAIAAEKTQIEELKTRLASTEKTSSENAELKSKLHELSELMKGLVRTNKGLETKLEEAKTEVKSAAKFQEKYMDLQIILQRLESKDIYKSKLIDLLKKENEDLQTKHKETIDSFEKLEGEMYEKLQDANHYILAICPEIEERAKEAMLSRQSLTTAASSTLNKCWSAEAMTNCVVTLENRLEQVGDLVNNLMNN